MLSTTSVMSALINRRIGYLGINFSRSQERFQFIYCPIHPLTEAIRLAEEQV